MKISPHPQGSVDWMIARSGIVTASEFDQIVTPEFKVRTGQMRQTYLCRKLAEWWTGGPLASLNTFDMDQGKVLEEEALPWVEFEYNCKVDRPGLITTDDGKAGCSPDGFIVKDGRFDCGLEIKCPAIHTHIDYVLKGELPKEYAPQVYGSLWVTGFSRWRFISYHRRLPKLEVEVERDEEIMEKLSEAIESFNRDFDYMKTVLIERNGGIPPKPMNTVAVTAPAPEYVDIIP